MIRLKKKFNAELDSEVLQGLHKYSVLKLNSESSIIQKALKKFLKDNPINKRKDLSPQEIIRRGPFGCMLKQREKKKLVNLLKNEKVYNHGKGDYLAPSGDKDYLYYVAEGAYIERRELPLANGGEVSITQDLISKDELFGEGFSYDVFSTYWEAIHGGRLLRISPDTINEIIRKIPNSRENLDYLILQKFRKMDYISTVRSGHLSSEDRVRYGFNFLVQRLGKTMNGDSSKIKVSMPFKGVDIPMGSYSDYGVLKKFKYEDLGDIISLSRESISRVLHHMCFNLNEKNFKIGFSKSGYTYVYKDLLNKEGKITKLSNCQY